MTSQYATPPEELFGPPPSDSSKFEELLARAEEAEAKNEALMIKVEQLKEAQSLRSEELLARAKGAEAERGTLVSELERRDAENERDLFGPIPDSSTKTLELLARTEAAISEKNAAIAELEEIKAKSFASNELLARIEAAESANAALIAKFDRRNNTPGTFEAPPQDLFGPPPDSSMPSHEVLLRAETAEAKNVALLEEIQELKATLQSTSDQLLARAENAESEKASLTAELEERNATRAFGAPPQDLFGPPADLRTLEELTIRAERAESERATLLQEIEKLKIATQQTSVHELFGTPPQDLFVSDPSDTNELKAQLEIAESQKAALLAEIEELKLSAQNSSYSSKSMSTAEKECSQEILAKAVARAENAESDAAALTAELEQLKATLGDAEARADAFVASIESKAAEKEEQMTLAMRDMEERAGAFEALRETAISHLDAEIRALKKDLGVEKEEKRALEKEAAVAREENENRIISLQRELSRLQAKLEQSQLAGEAHVAELGQQMEDARADSNRQIAELTKQLDSSREESIHVEELRASMEAELRKEFESTQTEYSHRLSDMIESHKKEIEQLRSNDEKELADRDLRIAELLEMIEELKEDHIRDSEIKINAALTEAETNTELAIEARLDEIRQDHARELEVINTAHAQELASLREAHAQDMSRAAAGYETRLATRIASVTAELELRHTAAMEELAASRDEELEETMAQLQGQIADARNRALNEVHDDFESRLTESVQKARAEAVASTKLHQVHELVIQASETARRDTLLEIEAINNQALEKIKATHETEIAALREHNFIELAQAKAELMTAQEDREAVERRVSAIDLNCVKAEERAAAAERLINELRHRLEVSASSAEVATDEVRRAGKRVREAENRICELETRLNQADITCREWKEKYKNVLTANSETVNLRVPEKFRQMRLQGLKAKEIATMMVREGVATTQHVAEELLEEAMSSNGRANAIQNELSSALDIERARAQKFESETYTMRTELEKERNRAKALETELEIVREEIQTETERADLMEDDAEDIRSKLEKEREEVARLNQEIVLRDAAAQAANEALRATMSEETTVITSAAQADARTQAEYELDTKRMKELEERLIAITHDRDLALSDAADAAIELVETRRRLDLVERRVAEVDLHTVQAQEMASFAEERLEITARELQVRTDDHESLSAIVADLETKLKSTEIARAKWEERALRMEEAFVDHAGDDLWDDTHNDEGPESTSPPAEPPIYFPDTPEPENNDVATDIHSSEWRERCVAAEYRANRLDTELKEARDSFAALQTAVEHAHANAESEHDLRSNTERMWEDHMRAAAQADAENRQLREAAEERAREAEVRLAQAYSQGYIEAVSSHSIPEKFRQMRRQGLKAKEVANIMVREGVAKTSQEAETLLERAMLSSTTTTKKSKPANMSKGQVAPDLDDDDDDGLGAEMDRLEDDEALRTLRYQLEESELLWEEQRMELEERKRQLVNAEAAAREYQERCASLVASESEAHKVIQELEAQLLQLRNASPAADVDEQTRALNEELRTAKIRAAELEIALAAQKSSAESSEQELARLEGALEEEERFAGELRREITPRRAPTTPQRRTGSRVEASAFTDDWQPPVASIEEEHNDLLALLAQQELEKNTLKAYVLDKIGDSALAQIKQEAEHRCVELYGMYVDYEYAGDDNHQAFLDNGDTSALPSLPLNPTAVAS
uniref:Uncharacterized protein n=1 Tax=Aureoumbra lagunensis TaxID=44058 RepID=A0A7S3NLU8_9STRA